MFNTNFNWFDGKQRCLLRHYVIGTENYNGLLTMNLRDFLETSLRHWKAKHCHIQLNISNNETALNILHRMVRTLTVEFSITARKDSRQIEEWEIFYGCCFYWDARNLDKEQIRTNMTRFTKAYILTPCVQYIMATLVIIVSRNVLWLEHNKLSCSVFLPCLKTWHEFLLFPN